MRRWIVYTGLLMMAGCQGATPAIDPLGTYGPTRIPPPPTGSAGRTDPYYRRNLASNDRERELRVGSLPTNGSTRFTSADPPSRSNRSDDEPRTSRAPRANDASASERLRESSGLDWRPPYRSNTSDRYLDERDSNMRSGAPRPRFSTSAQAGYYDDQQRFEPDPLNDATVERASRLSDDQDTYGRGRY